MTDLKPIECRAAILYEEGKPLVIESIRIEPPVKDQLRIRMVSAGICASDGHFVWGTLKLSEFGLQSPCALGHEGAGIVESIGPDVTGIEVGDHVLTTFVPKCYKCPYCTGSYTNVCAVENLNALGAVSNKTLVADCRQVYSFAGSGVYSEYINVKRSQVVKINSKANLEHSAIISCAVATGFYSATNQAKVKAGTTCAVWGLGAIGLNAIYGCKYSKAANIIGIDINNDKRKIGEEFGVTEFINPNELNVPLEQYLMEKYGGIDYAFECIGNQAVLNVALKSLSIFGTLAVVGLAPKGTKVTYETENLLLGRTIVGAYMGNKQCDEAYTELVEMYLQDKYNIDRLITNKFKLEQINEAFQTLKDGKCVRSLIIFDQN